VSCVTAQALAMGKSHPVKECLGQWIGKPPTVTSVALPLHFKARGYYGVKTKSYHCTWKGGAQDLV
jgi:hypothetical protein